MFLFLRKNCVVFFVLVEVKYHHLIFSFFFGLVDSLFVDGLLLSTNGPSFCIFPLVFFVCVVVVCIVIVVVLDF